MQFYLRLIICVVPLTLTLVFIRLIYKKDKKNKQKNILRVPCLFRIVAILMLGAFLISGICILLFQFEEWPYLLISSGVFGLPGLIMFIMWSLWRVDIKEDGFIYRNYFGRKKEYKFEDLEYQMSPKGLKWYFYKGNKKVFCMAYYIENGDFLEKMYRKYIRKVR